MRYIIVFMLLCSVCEAKQVYNGVEGRWETVPDDAQVSPRYNATEGDFSMQPAGAKTEYNPFSGKFEWDSGHNPSSNGD